MKKYYFLLLLIFQSIFAQPKFESNIIFVESELHIIKLSDFNKVLFLYKIPYSILVFNKQGDVFEAGFKVSVEILNKTSGEIKREFNEHHCTVTDFSTTNSPYIYLQGFLEFTVDKGEYLLTPVFTDLSSNRDLTSKPELFNTDSLISNIGNPVIVLNEKKFCQENEVYKISNHSSSIPFSSEAYSLLIPVYNEKINSLEITIFNEEGKFITESEKVTTFIYTSFNLVQCDGELFFKINNDKKSNNIKFFIIENISKKLPEGNYFLEIGFAEESDFNKKLLIPVRWINKPRSLLNPEKSLEYLSLIESQDVMALLKGVKKENLVNALFEFWKKYDPTPETIFNELMAEFYYRIDYAEQNFRALSSGNGAKSDRGKIFVRYGKPESMERFTDEFGRMIEQWKYSNPYLIFNFIDKKGTGNFTLMSSQ